MRGSDEEMEDVPTGDGADDSPNERTRRPSVESMVSDARRSTVSDAATPADERPFAAGPLSDRDRLFGLVFHRAADERAVAADLLAARLPIDRLPLVVTPNVDIVVQLTEPSQHTVLEVMDRAAYVLPDGWPIVKVSQYTDRPLPARLAGSNLFAELWPALAAARRSCVVVAANQSVLDGLANEHPDARFIVPPVISRDGSDADGVVADIISTAVESEAEYLFFGVGHPKDPILADRVLDRWPADRAQPICLCLGASAELYLGLRRRAPSWMQRSGLEWLHRFSQEPKRLFHRYFVRDAAFLPMAVGEVLRHRRPPTRR